MVCCWSESPEYMESMAAGSLVRRSVKMHFLKLATTDGPYMLSKCFMEAQATHKCVCTKNLSLLLFAIDTGAGSTLMYVCLYSYQFSCSWEAESALAEGMVLEQIMMLLNPAFNDYRFS